MTDLERTEELFKSMGVEYSKFKLKGVTSIRFDKGYYSEDLSIAFDFTSSGKFIEIEIYD